MKPLPFYAPDTTLDAARDVVSELKEGLNDAYRQLRELLTTGVTTAEPAQFREAVAAMNATTVRPEIELGPIRPPQRLAPYSYALGAEIRHPETAIVPERSEGDAFGRPRQVAK